ncbi:MAG: sulfite exporter TauE/SafE family protein [Rhodospirillales bacterium]|nr:MAG: sulfite exporter TauE/SafE family protein [Rhodospirillales bacterium]
MDLDLAVLLAGAFAAAFVTGVAGFAFGLVALSFWVWRYPIPELATLVVFGSLIAQSMAIPSQWRRVEWPVLAPMLVGAAFGLPIGTWLIARVDLATFRLSIGIVIAAFATFQLLAGGRLRVARAGKPADIAVGWASGVLGGLVGLCGVLPAVWGVLRGWTRERQRALFTMFNSFCHAVALAGLVVAGHIDAALAWRCAAMVPVLVVGAWIGAHAYRYVSPAGFRTLVLGLLLASGVALTFQALAGLAGVWTR